MTSICVMMGPELKKRGCSSQPRPPHPLEEGQRLAPIGGDMHAGPVALGDAAALLVLVGVARELAWLSFGDGAQSWFRHSDQLPRQVTKSTIAAASASAAGSASAHPPSSQGRRARRRPAR